jgi:hypothetical protein
VVLLTFRARIALAGVIGSVGLLTTTFLVAPPAAAEQLHVASGSDLVVQADFVQGVVNLAPSDFARLACVQTSRFPRNSEVVFRARVWDPVTANALDSQGLSSVQVNLTDGRTLEMEYGPHPANGPASDTFWSAAWTIPKDYPAGVVGYSIVATSPDERTGRFQPFDVAPSLLTVTSDVLPDIPPPQQG